VTCQWFSPGTPVSSTEDMNSFCLFATINIEGRESNTSQQKKDNNINIKSHNYNKTSGYNIKTALIKRERESYNTTFNNISAISLHYL
jgi:hypothetical protein